MASSHNGVFVVRSHEGQEANPVCFRFKTWLCRKAPGVRLRAWCVSSSVYCMSPDVACTCLPAEVYCLDIIKGCDVKPVQKGRAENNNNLQPKQFNGSMSPDCRRTLGDVRVGHVAFSPHLFKWREFSSTIRKNNWNVIWSPGGPRPKTSVALPSGYAEDGVCSQLQISK